MRLSRVVTQNGRNRRSSRSKSVFLSPCRNQVHERLALPMHMSQWGIAGTQMPAAARGTMRCQSG
jgi:hypothetical protein